MDASATPRLLLDGFVLLARFDGVAVSADHLVHDHPTIHNDIEPALLLAARRHGLKARWVEKSVLQVTRAPLPSLALG